MKFNLLKTIYKGILSGMPLLCYNPINQNTLNIPLEVSPFSTYLNFKLDDYQTSYLNNYIHKYNKDLEIVPIKMYDDENQKFNYLSVNIYNCTSPVFLNQEKEITRCEINTYVKDKIGNYGTLIIDYLSNEISMDPVNIFKFKENVNFYDNDIYKMINCNSFKDRVKLNLTISTVFDQTNKISDDLIKYTDKVFYKNGIYDKIYYDSSLADPDVRSPIIFTNFTFNYRDIVFNKIDSIFYFTNNIRFIGGMWENVYRI